MFIIHPYTKFKLPNSHSLLLVAIEQKAKYRFHAEAILLPYILQNGYRDNQTCKLLKGRL
jgi:hypothetical protein